MRNDRMSSYEQWDLPVLDALQREPWLHKVLQEVLGEVDLQVAAGRSI